MLYLRFGSESLTAGKQVKDLGINRNNDCKFNCHVNQITVRAHARANLVHKCFVSKDTNTLVNAFTTYVCTHCWNMHHVCGRLVALLILKKLNLSNSVLQRGCPIWQHSTMPHACLL